MRTNKYLLLFQVSLLALILPIMEASAAAPPELIKIQSSYAIQLEGAGSAGEKLNILREYARQLTSLESNMLSNMRSRSEVNEVRKELREVNSKIASGVAGDDAASQPAPSSGDEDKKYKEPPELIALREKFIARKDGLPGRQGTSDLLREYVQALTSLENNLRSNMQTRNSVNAVRSEIRKARIELADSSVVQSVFSSAPVASRESAEEEKPVVVKPLPPVTPIPVRESEPVAVTAEKKKVETEQSAKPLVQVPPPVVPLSLPNIVPVVAIPLPEPDKVPPQAVRRVEKQIESAPVVEEPAFIDPPPQMVKGGSRVPEDLSESPVPVAAVKSEPVAPVAKPPAPQAVPVPIVRTGLEPVTEEPVAVVPEAVRVEAKPAPEPVVPKTHPVPPPPEFRPAAPKPLPVAATRPITKPVPEPVTTTAPTIVPITVETAKPGAVPVQAIASKPVEKPVAALPVPSVSSAAAEKPAAARTSARTHVDETRGIAGPKSVRKNYAYAFNLDKLGKKTTLTFYAAGRHSNDTFGKIWLINQNDRPVKIGKWKSADFSKTADKVSSYRELEPVTIDISDSLTKPGSYKIEFEWDDFGKEPLEIFRVEIAS
ncbi:MAG: hypothetical protein KKG47_10925 [Proteobacteria bacterium]|nr:hypothetical protein [Pseudomonadota bacterium]MBU1738617.1 hypothetical protein [Pseudomonadota bacterium]